MHSIENISIDLDDISSIRIILQHNNNKEDKKLVMHSNKRGCYNRLDLAKSYSLKIPCIDINYTGTGIIELYKKLYFITTKGKINILDIIALDINKQQGILLSSTNLNRGLSIFYIGKNTEKFTLTVEVILKNGEFYKI